MFDLDKKDFQGAWNVSMMRNSVLFNRKILMKLETEILHDVATYIQSQHTSALEMASKLKFPKH